MQVIDFKSDHKSTGEYIEGELEQTSNLSKSVSLIVDGQFVYLPKRHVNMRFFAKEEFS